jgi:hypothetical protein
MLAVLGAALLSVGCGSSETRNRTVTPDETREAGADAMNTRESGKDADLVGTDSKNSPWEHDVEDDTKDDKKNEEKNKK